jgi:site-specific DNA-methyltransferase (adenine-specific)
MLSQRVETEPPKVNLGDLTLGFPHAEIGNSLLINADCFEWLRHAPHEIVHAVVVDPPFGIKEFEPEQLEKREDESGGTWRQPPSFDGSVRSPLPRFTALSPKERATIYRFFSSWSHLVTRVLKPGGHVIIATNSFLSQLVFSSLLEGGLEYRGQIIRLVTTLRGGDRPKNAEDVYPDVCSMPRGSHEPWGLFRKPMPKNMTVKDCLETYGTGGLRRLADGTPFVDVIPSERTPKREKDIADHPTLKSQSYMRQIVRTSLPLGSGIVLDTFMGAGSTIAAAESLGYTSIGIERNSDYFRMSLDAVPKLTSLEI